MNLDFFSQKPDRMDGRIEREINAGNVLIKLLNEHQAKGFVLLYTTLLDQVDVSLDGLVFSLSTLQGFSNPTRCMDEKVDFIITVIV